MKVDTDKASAFEIYIGKYENFEANLGRRTFYENLFHPNTRSCTIFLCYERWQIKHAFIILSHGEDVKGIGSGRNKGKEKFESLSSHFLCFQVQILFEASKLTL